jgi:hypothetical protein
VREIDNIVDAHVDDRLDVRFGDMLGQVNDRVDVRLGDVLGHHVNERVDVRVGDMLEVKADDLLDHKLDDRLEDKVDLERALDEKLDSRLVLLQQSVDSVHGTVERVMRVANTGFKHVNVEVADVGHAVHGYEARIMVLEQKVEALQDVDKRLKQIEKRLSKAEAREGCACVIM